MSHGVTARKPTNATRAASSSHRRGIVLGAAIIVLAALAVYHNTFAVPFLFDDIPSITRNATIHHLWPIGDVLSPPATSFVGGRPAVNLSLAVNYAFGGTAVWGYHALNLAIHILAGLVLYEIVRRTLLRPVLRDRFGAFATRLALAVAVLWTVHPLQTEAVTYISERCESLMGLFYLLTLYCFIRGTDAQRSGWWFALAVVACALGMASKEVMVTAPLMVLLYDRTFVSGGFRKAWTRHRRLYLGLACTWLLLGCEMIGLHYRGAGYGLGITWWAYALTECRAVAHYLCLALWPHPLVFDYGEFVRMPPIEEVAPYAVILAVLVAGVLVELKRRPVIGFVGAWFFMIVAPTSTVVPVAGQPMAEHRMYLPLAAVVTLTVVLIYALLGRRSMPVFLALALGLGFLAIQRNEDYRTELSIWNDTVAKCPDNTRARSNLGKALEQSGRFAEAEWQYEQAVRLKPGDAGVHNNLGNGLLKVGKVSEAMAQYELALKLRPDDSEAHNNLGNTLLQVGKPQEAVGHYEQGLRLEPDNAEAHNNLGLALERTGKALQAERHYEQALRIKPDYPEALNNLAWLLATRRPTESGDSVRAVALADRACKLSDHPAASYLDTLAAAYAAAGRFDDAVTTAQEAVELARASSQSTLAKKIEGRLQLYRNGQAYRQVTGVTQAPPDRGTR